PTKAALDLSGLKLSDDALDTLLGVDLDVWDEEASLVVPHYEKFGAKLPKRLWDEHKALLARLKDARAGKLKLAAARGGRRQFRSSGAGLYQFDRPPRRARAGAR
ncbi:MAG TPA: phosphoenolpyruvate carboxykinase domain-containing protein, partial [Terricaulis sp.]|nr:phosphoenolpyruvate carboxykinase domain-containing protein [Terricaulis sp.]